MADGNKSEKNRKWLWSCFLVKHASPSGHNCQFPLHTQRLRVYDSVNSPTVDMRWAFLCSYSDFSASICLLTSVSSSTILAFSVWCRATSSWSSSFLWKQNELHTRPVLQKLLFWFRQTIYSELSRYEINNGQTNLHAKLQTSYLWLLNSSSRPCCSITCWSSVIFSSLSLSMSNTFLSFSSVFCFSL